MPHSRDWLATIGRLKIDRSKGPAPHKPLLLLAVLELAEQGELPADVLPLSPALAFRFATFWSVAAHRRRQRPDVRLPFLHLKSDGFWQPLDARGQPASDRKQPVAAALDPEFVAFAAEPVAREQARRGEEGVGSREEGGRGVCRLSLPRKKRATFAGAKGDVGRRLWQHRRRRFISPRAKPRVTGAPFHPLRAPTGRDNHAAGSAAPFVSPRWGERRCSCGNGYQGCALAW
jgi:hypothetical protein